MTATFRLPKAEDRLFRFQHGRPNTIIPKNAHDRLQTMINGYREAVETLAVSALAERRHNDRLVYPIVFLYRHLFEISLKAIVQISGHRVAVTPNFKEHGLLPRWEEALLVIDEMQLRGLEGEEYVGSLLKEFDENDQRSFNFRYHTDTKGKPKALLHHEFDLLGFVEAADAVGNYLDSIVGQIWEREEHLLELEAEARNQL